MDHKVITLDVFGSKADTVYNQKKLLSTMPHVGIFTHINADFAGYFNKLDSHSDILIINLGEQAIKAFQCLEYANTAGKSIVVIGDKSNINLLSHAIGVGVSQFIDAADYETELVKAVNKVILHRFDSSTRDRKRKLNAIINAKGGSGASFIASNVAYKLSEFREQKVSLLDLDLQFGTVGLNFDVVSKYTITDALNSIGEMDHISLEAYLIKYNDRLKLLLPSADEIVLPGEIEPQAIKSLLYILQRNYSQVLIDLPRIIDPLSTMVFELADNITIVVQQTLAQYRDGRRLIQILNKDLDIPLDKIVVVINRYDPKNSLKKSDMVKLVNHDNVFTIDNDFERVAMATNLGEPLCQSAPNSKIAHDLNALAMYLGEVNEVVKKQGMLGRLKAIFA